MATNKLYKSFNEITKDRIDVNSQLQLHNIFENNVTKERFGNIFKSYFLSEGIDTSLYYETYTIDNEEWGENIAFIYYGDVTVGGVIPLINNIINPFEMPEPGSEIYILKPSYLNKLLDEVYAISDL